MLPHLKNTAYIYFVCIFINHIYQMKSEMPRALSTIEAAASSLEEASNDLNLDPYSQVSCPTSTSSLLLDPILDP